MSFYWLILGIFAVWRATHLFQAEDGPWNLVTRLRLHAGDGVFGALLDCFYCLSLWIAIPLALLLGETWIEQIILWPALSAGAIFLERLLPEERQQATPAIYFEHEEKSDGMLRTAETGHSRSSPDKSGP